MVYTATVHKLMGKMILHESTQNKKRATKMQCNTEQSYKMAGERKNKESKLNQERPSGRIPKENNGHDLGDHGRRHKDKKNE